jgi:tape measure domain-containing protein
VKTPVLNLKINTDLKAAVASLKGLGKTVGPVEVQAQLNLQKIPSLKVDVSAGANLGAIAAQRFISDATGIKVGFDLKQLEEAGDKLSGKLSSEISRASRGGGFGGIIGTIGQTVTAPLRLATDTIKSTLTGAIFGITRELTTDLGKGIRKSVEDAAGGTIGSTELLGRKAGDALFHGIQSGRINDLPALLESKLVNTPRIAAVARKLAQAYVDNFSEGLKSKTEQVGAAIAAIVPREERLVAAGVRRQTEKRQTASDRGQAQEAVFEQRRELGRRIQQRGEEIPRQIAQIDTAVEATKANEDFQKPIKDLQRRINRLKKTNTAEFTPDQKNDLKFAIADLTNQYAALIKPLADAAQKRQELQQELVSLNAARAKLIQDYKLLGGREERRSVLFEEGAKLSGEAKKVQSDLVKQKELLVKNAEIQKRIFRELAKADDSKKAVLTQQYNSTIAFSDAVNKSVKILEERNKTLTEQIGTVSKQYQAIPASTPKAVQDIAAQLAGNAGIEVNPENLPPVVRGSNATLGRARASYIPELNSIALRDELFDAVQQGLTLTPAQKRDLTEEVAHSLQIDLGSFEGFRNFEQEKSTNKVYDPTPEDALRLTPELAGYARAGKSQDIIKIELEAKAAADALVASTQSIEQQAQELNQFQQQFGQLGDKLKRLLGFDVSAGKNKIAQLLPLAASQGTDAVNQLQDLEQLLDTIDKSSADVFREIAAAQIGQNPTLNIKAAENTLREQVGKSTAARERIAEVEQSLRPPKPPEPGGAIAQVAQKIEPAGGIVLRGAEMAGTALTAVAKAGLSLADKIGFAATSFIPGGALLYDPVLKPVAKTAAVGGALAAAGATIPGAAEILGAITSSISAILAPATSGLAEGIGASVSADIVGALPHLFQQLSGAIASSGLPGSEMSAQAVNLLGGQLTHFLQPVVQGVASTADGVIVSVGTSVQGFLAELGTILVAGKGVETGVKLATNEGARAAALQGIQTVGEGVGQFVNAVPEAIDKVQTAVDRTSRAVQKNVEEIKDAGARIAQGELKAVGEIVESGQNAAANIARGASDVAKASTKAAQDIVEGAGKVSGVFGKLASQSIPGINDLGELSKDALVNVYNQLSKKLESVLNAEIEAISKGNAAGTGRSSILKGDLNRVANVLAQKYQHTIEIVAQEIVDEPLVLPAKIKLPELDPIEIQVEPPKELKKAQLDRPSNAVRTVPAASAVTVQDEPVVIAPRKADDPRVIYEAQIRAIDESIDATENDIRQYYAELAGATKDYKTAIKKGSASGAQSAQDAAQKASAALFKEINETSEDLKNVLEALASIGIDLSPTDPIRDRIRKLNAEIESKRKLGGQRLAQVGLSGQSTSPDSLEALDTTALQESLDSGAKSLSKALKSLVETIFEVEGKTLRESLALAANSPRGRDLAVNAVGLAGGLAAGSQGPVAGLAGDLIAALSARQAIGGGGPETFGDITGFLTGNIANQITGVPGSGAVAAAAIVPQLQKLRDSLQAQYGQPIEIPLEFDGLQALDLEYLRATEQIKELDKLIDRLGKVATEGEQLRTELTQFPSNVHDVAAPVESGNLLNKYLVEAAQEGKEKQKDLFQLRLEKAAQEGRESQPQGIPSNVREQPPLIQVPTLTNEERAAENQKIEGARLVGKFKRAEVAREVEAARLEAETLAKRKEEVEAFEAKEKARSSQKVSPVQLSEEQSKLLAKIEAEQVAELEREQAEPEKLLSKPVKSQLSEEVQAKLDRTDAALRDLEAQTENYIQELNQGTEKQAAILQERAAKRRARTQAAIDLTDQKRLEEGEQVGPTGRRFVVGPTGLTKEEKVFLPQDIQSESQKANLEAKQILESTEGSIKGPDPKETRALLKKIQEDEIRFNLALEAMEEEVRQLEAGGGGGGGKGGLLGRGIAGGGGPGGPLDSVKRIGDGLKQLAVDAGVPIGAIGKLGGLLKGVGVAALAYVAVNSFGEAIVQAGKAAFDTAINMERLQTRLEFTVGGPAAAAKEMDFLRSQSESLQLPLQGLVESYSQFAIASKNTAVEGGRTREAFEGLTTAARVYGLSQDQISRVTEQVGQGFRKQRVDTEDLKTIAEGGIPIFDALGRSMGKSGTELQKAIENGEVTSIKLADALKLVGDESKTGLAAAMATGGAAIDSLKKQIEDLQIAIGPTVVEGFKLIAAGVVAGINLLEDAGSRLAPVFGAIAEGAKLAGTFIVPLAQIVAAVAVSIGKDLLTGFALPFEAIREGLAAIRETVEAVFSAIGQAVEAAGKQMSGLLESVPILKAIAENANPATLAIQALGVAIGLYAVAQTVQLTVGIGRAILAMGAFSVATWSSVIPALGAATTAALAFLATPLGLTLAAIGIAAALSAPHIDDLARSVSGLSEAQLKSNERAISFGSDYEKALTQLQKGIPLTADELQKLKEGFAQNVKEGRESAQVAGTLTAQLERLQVNAQAAATIQGRLAKAMADSTKEIKSQSTAIDAEYNTRSSALNELLANQAITKERFDQQELEAQQEKTQKYLNLYDEQANGLSASLSSAQNQLAQPMPPEARQAVVKQVEELQDKLNGIEENRGQQRIQLAQSRQKVIEKIEADRIKRAENDQKVIENQVAAGLQPQIEGEIALSALKQQESQRRIAALDKQIETESNAAGELTEIGKNLYSERQVLESELTKTIADETQKRYEYYRAEIEQNLALLNTAIVQSQAQSDTELQKLLNGGLITQKQFEERKLNLTRDRLQKELALEQTNLKLLGELPSPSSPEKEREHQKAIRESRLKTAQLTQQLAEQEYQEIQKTRELAIDAIEERVKSFNNALTEIGQATEALDIASKVATDGLERQNKLLESKKALSASIAGLVEQEYKILIDGEKDADKKAKLQEQAAIARLDALKQAQKIEQQIFELQLKQEEIQSRLAITKAQANVAKQEAEVAKAQAEEEKVGANPEATAADKRAAALGVRSAQIGSVAASIELEGLTQADRQREDLARSRREANSLNNRKDLLVSRYDLAQLRTDPDRKERELQQLQGESRQGIRSRRSIVLGDRPRADYGQVDSAQSQLGLLPKDANLGALLAAKQPVDLHSGASAQISGLSDLNGEFKRLADLTSAGVVGNLLQLVGLQQNLAVQLQSLASKPRLEQTIHNYTSTKRSSVLAGSGL